MKYHQGKYKPKKPEKYVGDPTNVIYRSSWEKKFLIWCDESPNVLKYSSEEVVIPYRCPTDKRVHRYFVDAKVAIKESDGSVGIYLVEIKPAAQTTPPEFKGKKTKRYITESLTYMKNRAKWEAAENYAKDRGWKFIILTEKELGV